MIKKLAVSISLFFYFSGISQVTINKTITSEFLQDTRDIRIYLPEGYEVETEKNYPLAIVLDAEYLFDLYIGNSVLFAKKDKAPQQIVVGITMAETRAQDTYFNKNTGKLTLENSAFYKFIRDELIFEIESNYRTSPFISLINDSLKTDSNISAISEAIPRALTKIFEIYSAISKEEFETKIKDLSPIDAISYLENKYLEIEFLFGGSLGIRERDIYAIESIIIEKDNGDQLMEFGKMILNLFPSSPLGNYYIGMFYETGKQNKKALEQYKIGCGKMDPSDPKADAFYENVLRVGGQ